MQIMLYYIGYYNQHLSRLTERVKFFSRNGKEEENSEKSYQHYCLDKNYLSFELSPHLTYHYKIGWNPLKTGEIFLKSAVNDRKIWFRSKATGGCSDSSSVICIKCSDQANIYWCNFFLSSHKSTEGCLKVLNSAMQSMIGKKKKEKRNV